MASSIRGATLALVLWGCAGQATSAPPTASDSPAASKPDPDATVGPAPGAAASGADPLASEPSAGSVLVPVEAAPDFGHVAKSLEEGPTLWTFPPRRAVNAPRPQPQRYERWREKKKITVGFSHLSLAELSDDARYVLAVSQNEAKLRIYDTQSGRLLAKHGVKEYEQWGRGDFIWQPGDGSPPAVLFAHPHGIEALDALTGTSLRQLSADGAWALRASDDGSVLIAALSAIETQTSVLMFYGWRGDALELVLTLQFTERVDGFDLSPDKSLLAVSLYPSNSVELLDLRQHRLLWNEAAPAYVSSVDLSPDGALLAVGGSAVVVYDTKDPSRRSAFTELGNNVDHVRFAPAGDALAVSAYDGRVRLLRPGANGQPLSLLKLLRHAGSANVYALSFTGDGSRLLTSSGDMTLRLWGE